MGKSKTKATAALAKATPKKKLPAALEGELRKSGFDRARVSAVATKPGQPADVRIERVPLAELGKLGRAVTKHG